MSALVQKFGGTSVATIERIRNVAARVLAARQAGHDVAVVVSAMATETDRLLSLVRQMNPSADRRESDVVASSGETISAALTALAIQSLGGKARSILGFQLPLLTDDQASNAQIQSVNPQAIFTCFANDEIPVIAGFQGVDSAGRVTTLGRGGSDTTAVAIAAALKGSRCEIYTDVDGVFTADPRICPRANLLPQVSYRFMIEAAGLGAKVMHDRSVEFGLRYQVPIQVKSSLKESTGTSIGMADVPSNCITLLNMDKQLAKVSWVGKLAEEATGRIRWFSDHFKRNGLAHYGVSTGPMSFSFLVPQTRAVEAVQWMHSLCPAP